MQQHSQTQKKNNAKTRCVGSVGNIKAIERAMMMWVEMGVRIIVEKGVCGVKKRRRQISPTGSCDFNGKKTPYVYV